MRMMKQILGIMLIPLAYTALFVIGLFLEDDIPTNYTLKGFFYSFLLLTYFSVTALRWKRGKGRILFVIGLSFMSIGAIGAFALVFGASQLAREEILPAVAIALTIILPVAYGWNIFIRDKMSQRAGD